MRDYDSTMRDEKQEENYIKRAEDELNVKFAPKKRHGLLLADSYERLRLDGRAQRVKDCGTWYEFVKRWDEDRIRLHRANFCKDRLCPLCNKRRSLKIYAQTSAIMDYLEPMRYRYIFLTLTIKNVCGAELPKTVGELLDGWRRMINGRRELRRLIKGSQRALEITWSRKTGYHPHIHAILAVPQTYRRGQPQYIEADDWRRYWIEAMSLDYTPQIKLEFVRSRKMVAEISKYTVKDMQMLGPEALVDDNGEIINGEKLLTLTERDKNVAAFLQALTRRRLVEFAGCFREARAALRLDDAEDGDLVVVDGQQMREDVIELLMTFCWRAGVYVIDSIDRR